MFTYITLLDYLVLPFVVGFVYFVVLRIRNASYPKGHPWRAYFLPAFHVKIIGAVVNGALHYYYYGGGDTFRFFHDALVINRSFSESFVTWFNLIFHIPDAQAVEYYKYTSDLIFYEDPSSYTVSAIGAFFGLFTFNTYLPISVLFAFASFSGVWALFRTFAKLYPHLIKPIAAVTLFIPTVALWGSAMYKDTICIFGLGWLTYGVFRFLVQRDFSPQNIALAALSVILISRTKMYILIAFLPALGMWILFNYTKSIRIKALKRLVTIIVPLLVVGASVMVMSAYSKELGIYSLDRIADASEEMREYVYAISVAEEGSAYTLGDFNPTLTGMLSKFPQAVNVSLFRPYPWEAKKLIMVFSAAESLLFLILTLRVLFAVRLAKTWKAISGDPTIQFCLIYSIIFAFAVGITTYNFGSLSRYKIPCLPFYALAMVLLYYKHKPAGQKVLPPLF